MNEHQKLIEPELTAWRSRCCQAPPETTEVKKWLRTWWEISPGGKAELWADGYCSKCGEQATFVREDE